MIQSVSQMWNGIQHHQNLGLHVNSVTCRSGVVIQIS